MLLLLLFVIVVANQQLSHTVTESKGEEGTQGTAVDWEFAQRELAMKSLKSDKEWEEEKKQALDAQVCMCVCVCV